MKVTVNIGDEAFKRLEELAKKHGFEIEELLSKIINDIALHELEDIIGYANYHDYGKVTPTDRLAEATIDVLELGILTHNCLEQYILEELGARNYWLQDYGIDLDSLEMWFLFAGTGLIEEFTLDISPDGASIIVSHGIDDLVTESPSILDKLREATEKIETEHEIVIEEDEIRIIARAGSFTELPKIKELEELMKRILGSAGIDVSKRI